jgi:hypothetical protein
MGADLSSISFIASSARSHASDTYTYKNHVQYFRSCISRLRNYDGL